MLFVPGRPLRIKEKEREICQRNISGKPKCALGQEKLLFFSLKRRGVKLQL